MFTKFVNEPIETGMDPRNNRSALFNRKHFVNIPAKLFDCKYKLYKLVNDPIVEGIDPIVNKYKELLFS